MILVFGTVCLDRVMRVPHLPSLGGYVGILDEAVYLGGEAANTAHALKSWGADVVLVGNGYGEGADAETLEHLLDQKGLKPAAAPNAQRTPVCDIYVTPDGERRMFGRGFSEMTFDLPLDQIPFQAGAWFTAEPNMSEDARRVAAEAYRRGMKLYLMDFFRDDDTIPAGAWWQCSTDWVGQRGNPQANMDWVRAWVDRHACHAILSDGPRGFVFGSPEHEPRHFEAVPATMVVDSTGAGDTFRAGMLFSLDQGWPVERCLAFASAAGSLSCGFIGATTGVPSVEAVLAHMRMETS